MNINGIKTYKAEGSACCVDVEVINCISIISLTNNCESLDNAIVRDIPGIGLDTSPVNHGRDDPLTPNSTFKEFLRQSSVGWLPAGLVA
jgi:hypothetical protein